MVVMSYFTQIDLCTPVPWCVKCNDILICQKDKSLVSISVYHVSYILQVFLSKAGCAGKAGQYKCG